MAMDSLQLKAEECVYVGDGDSNELTGAQEVGMHPVMIQVEYDSKTGDYLADRQEWDGPVISSLTEILNLVE